MLAEDLLSKWNNDGYVPIEPLLAVDELAELQDECQLFLKGHYNTSGLRSDLSGKSQKNGKERITQIMRPSLIKPELLSSRSYQKIMEVGQLLVGEDADIDFDMLINKSPYTNTITPWHQDAAYWPNMPDRRSCSIWIALDDVDEANGCMCYIGKSHVLPLREHAHEYEGGALQTKIDSNETISFGILAAGSAIAHHGYTLHSALGNESNRNRRAWIVNFRPKSMIKFLRDNGYDHTGTRKTRANE